MVTQRPKLPAVRWSIVGDFRQQKPGVPGAVMVAYFGLAADSAYGCTSSYDLDIAEAADGPPSTPPPGSGGQLFLPIMAR